ncbi:MAG: glycoside hydrolase family 97 protein [Ignavibacteriales bacterium]|nr:glycoside hydrolase family 97 protein [Ignavibacteriales bacterium]
MRHPVITRACSLLVLLELFLIGVSAGQDKNLSVKSPNGRSELRLDVGDRTTISIFHRGQVILPPSRISMDILQRQILGQNPEVKGTTPTSVKTTIQPVVAEKRKIIPDVYNELTISFKGDYGLKLRAYDDGVAYRFFTTIPGTLKVKNEELSLDLSPSDSVWFGEEKSFLSHSERDYKLIAVKDIADTQFCVLPAVLVEPNGLKIAISEADLMDYAGLYLRGNGATHPGLNAKFPPYPLEEQLVRDRTIKVTKAADYIAETRGVREFPWRVFAIAEKDGDIIENDIIYRLGSPLRLKETSWIKPGKVAWDWWNANNIYGVDFKSGINTETYKYYIDFVSRHKLEYVIFDEGWSNPGDLSKINPSMDMDKLFAFAKQKNVGIILWVTSKALDERMTESLDQFEKWGAKGIKVDFMQRDDQKMVNFYERTAIEAAKRHLLVDFHGAYKPTGFSRTFPHAMTREGVRGLENNKWATDLSPGHDVTLPFTRMFAGAMDYTPGAMRNATKENFRAVFTEPMTQGTRCHQLAMYVVYESPLQMLSDSPPQYEREPVILDFLSTVPTTWDDTKALNAKIGEYLTVARKKGSDWYVGSMTNWTPREFQISLAFLDAGTYEMTVFSDGINADHYAADYKKTSKNVTNADVISLNLAPGGGWVALIHKVH